MDQGQRDVALRATEVPMLEPEIVRQIRGLAAMSWGSKRIAATLGISRGSRPAVPARRGAGSAGAAASATARRRAAHGRGGAARRRGRGQCGRRAAAARRAGDRRGAADAAARGRAASAGAARRRGRDGALRDGAGAPAADRLRREVGPHRRRARCACYFFVAVLGYSRRIFVRAFLQPAAGRLARGTRRRVPALRRRHADGARRQRRRARRRARPRDRRRARASGVRRVLPRLGRDAARVPAVSRAHQGQDRVAASAT